MSLVDALRGAEACKPALAWIEQYSTFEDAWDGCHRGDWLLWFAHILGVNPHLVVQTAIRCAQLGLKSKKLIVEVALAITWKAEEIDSSRIKRARWMVELASHRGFAGPPDMDVLQSMVEVVRQQIPWSLVKAQIEIIDGKLVRKIDQ